MEENKTDATGRYRINGNSHVIGVPRLVRQTLHLVKGDYVAFTVVGDRVVMRKITREFILGKDQVDVRTLQTPLRREGTHDGD